MLFNCSNQSLNADVSYSNCLYSCKKLSVGEYVPCIYREEKRLFLIVHFCSSDSLFLDLNVTPRRMMMMMMKVTVCFLCPLSLLSQTGI